MGLAGQHAIVLGLPGGLGGGVCKEMHCEGAERVGGDQCWM